MNFINDDDGNNNNNNNKLINPTTNTNSNVKENLVLHVALQTMKERCQSLQQRLATVEDENLGLRMKIGLDKPMTTSAQRINPSEPNNNNNNYDDTGQSTTSLSSSSLLITELDVLRDSVATLTRQKIQLSDHVAMIATENRQLWARLSKLTKDNETLLGNNSLNQKIKDNQMQSIISDTSASPPATMISNGSTSPTSTIAGGGGGGEGGVGHHQNLIRSKTFTQNSPNPLLRQKLNYDNLTSPSVSTTSTSTTTTTTTTTTNITENQMTPTLEEISLHVLNEFLNGQAEIEQKCNEITNQSKPPTSSRSTIDNKQSITPFNFGYLNVDTVDTVGNDVTTTTTTSTSNSTNTTTLQTRHAEEDMIEDDNAIGGDDGATKKMFLKRFVDIKKEVLRQQSDLKVALSSLRQRKGTIEICAACKNHQLKQTVDKYVSTDNIEMNQSITTANKITNTTATQSQSHQQQLLQQQQQQQHKIDDSNNKYDLKNVKLLDLNEQKRMADSANKMCPMCGDIYSNAISFETFQDHVEAHFIDDSDLLDTSIEKKYEFVSHTVGNF